MFLKNDKHITGINKADFLTIPDAPNYEINGYFKVRNKKTGRLISTKKRIGRKTVVASICSNKKNVKRDVKTFYHQALMNAFYSDGWYPICSLNKLYEITWLGEVRNAKTKMLLKPILDQNCLLYNFWIDGKVVVRTRRALLNEVFATNIRPKKAPVPVILSKDGLQYYFKNKTAAAKFLEPKVFFNWETIVKRMSNREPTVYGWNVKYLGVLACKK